MGIAERRYQRLTAGFGLLRNPYRGEKIDKVVKVETKGNPKIWGTKCRSDVTGAKKNLNVQWNSRPKSKSRAMLEPRVSGASWARPDWTRKPGETIGS